MTIIIISIQSNEDDMGAKRENTQSENHEPKFEPFQPTTRIPVQDAAADELGMDDFQYATKEFMPGLTSSPW